MADMARIIPAVKAAPTRRSRKQIAADEKAVQRIAELVKVARRFDFKHLQATLDIIADELVEAGRL